MAIFPDDYTLLFARTITSADVIGSSSFSGFAVPFSEANFPNETMDDGPLSLLNGGGDLRYSSDIAGTIQLECQVWNFVTDPSPANQKAEVYVPPPTLFALSDTVIYGWGLVVGDTQPASTDTFGSQAVWTDYDTVSHDGGKTDSTGNDTPVIGGSPVDVAGPFTDATDYGDRSDTWFYSLDVSLTAVVTFQAWAYVDGDAGGTTWLMAMNSTDGGGVKGGPIINGGTDKISVWDNSNGFFDGTTTRPLDTWYSHAAIYNGSTDREIFFNGDSEGTETTITAKPSSNPFLRVGNGWSSSNWQGFLAEIRTRNSVLSDDWIETEYDAQSDPINFGSTELLAGGFLPKLTLLGVG